MSGYIKDVHSAIEELTKSTAPLTAWYLFGKYQVGGFSMHSELKIVGLGESLMVYYNEDYIVFYIPKDLSDMEDYMQRGFYHFIGDGE